MQMDLSLHTELVGAGLLANSKLKGSLQLRQEKNLPYMIRTSPSAQKVSCLCHKCAMSQMGHLCPCHKCAGRVEEQAKAPAVPRQHRTSLDTPSTRPWQGGLKIVPSVWKGLGQSVSTAEPRAVTSTDSSLLLWTKLIPKTTVRYLLNTENWIYASIAI